MPAGKCANLARKGQESMNPPAGIFNFLCYNLIRRVGKSIGFYLSREEFQFPQLAIFHLSKNLCYNNIAGWEDRAR
jgi:hypothetical protein